MSLQYVGLNEINVDHVKGASYDEMDLKYK